MSELDDQRALGALGYTQELARRMGGFSNFAISLSIICILSGGVTSFHLGLCGVGGASIGLGWPLAVLLSLTVAATMAQVASAYPTAGGLYHWASILGGRGWGWATAWFNLAGLVAVLAAINVGTYRFAVHSLGWEAGQALVAQAIGVATITFSQAFINHVGIRAVTRLTDLSGYLILIVSAALIVLLLAHAENWDVSRLVTFANFSGDAGANVWPRTESIAWLFALGLLLPAYTITGFDASAHTAEETVDAGVNVPRGIVRSVLVSGLAGWLLLSAVVLAIPSLDDAVTQGEGAFVWTMARVLPGGWNAALLAGIGVAQYLCGLATVTSASRMAYAFARDGGLPASDLIRYVSPRFRTPTYAIWVVAIAAVAFTIWTPVYATITAASTVFLYVSYVIPTALGIVAWGRTWTMMGPWQLGPWYRPLAIVSVVGSLGLVAILIQPPNEKAGAVLAIFTASLAIAWLAVERRRFPGPPMPKPGTMRAREAEEAHV